MSTNIKCSESYILYILFLLWAWRCYNYWVLLHSYIVLFHDEFKKLKSIFIYLYLQTCFHLINQTINQISKQAIMITSNIMVWLLWIYWSSYLFYVCNFFLIGIYIFYWGIWVFSFSFPFNIMLLYYISEWLYWIILVLLSSLVFWKPFSLSKRIWIFWTKFNQLITLWALWISLSIHYFKLHFSK